MVLMLQVALFLTLASPLFAINVPLELINTKENSGLEIKMKDVNESVVDRCTSYPCEVWVKRTRAKGKAYNLPILKVISCNGDEVKFKIRKVVRIMAVQNEPGEKRTVGLGLKKYMKHIKEKLKQEGKKLAFGPDIHYTLKSKTRVTIKIPGVTRISVFYKFKESDKGRKGYLLFKSKVKPREKSISRKLSEEASLKKVASKRPGEKIRDREIQIDNIMRENAFKKRLARKLKKLQDKRRFEELKKAYMEKIRLRKYQKKQRRLRALRKFRKWLKRKLDLVNKKLESENKEELPPPTTPKAVEDGAKPKGNAGSSSKN